jgi:hypothetical protein
MLSAAGWQQCNVSLWVAGNEPKAAAKTSRVLFFRIQTAFRNVAPVPSGGMELSPMAIARNSLQFKLLLLQ